MGCNQSKMHFPGGFKRKRATKLNTWSVATEENDITTNSPCGQYLEQTPPSLAPIRYSSIYEDEVSTLISLTGKADDIEIEYLTRRTAEGYRACLSYEGYHEYGFHLFTVYPRLFLEFINDNDEKILTLSHEEYMAALEQFMCYIQGVIKSQVKDDAFVLVSREVPDKIGCFTYRCVTFTRQLCNKMQTRFGKSLKRIVIYRPVGLLCFKLAKRSRKRPFARLAITESKLLLPLLESWQRPQASRAELSRRIKNLQ